MGYLKPDEISAIRQFTGNLYDYPPDVWLRFTYKGKDIETAPKITATDRIILRYLFKGARYNPQTGLYCYKTSVRGIARRNLLGKTQVIRAINRLTQSGAVEVEPIRGTKLSSFNIKHFGADSEYLNKVLKEVFDDSDD